MASIWQKLTRKKVVAPEPVAAEETIFNPLGLRTGQLVKINTIDLDAFNFHVTAFREVMRKIGNEVFTFIDYDIAATDATKTIHKRLRLTPMADPASDLTHDVLLLDLKEEFEYDENMHKNDLTLEITDGEAKYWRVNDVETPYSAKIVVLEDTSHDGIISANEISRGSMTYWDYWRDTDDAVREFYIVEMNGSNGWFQIWVGSMINPTRVEV